MRFGFSAAGGLAIVVLVLIVAVGRAPARTLATVLAAVFLFALAVALVWDARPSELLAATAAYAAVLMVFMGNGP